MCIRSSCHSTGRLQVERFGYPDMSSLRCLDDAGVDDDQQMPTKTASGHGDEYGAERGTCACTVFRISPRIIMAGVAGAHTQPDEVAMPRPP